SRRGAVVRRAPCNGRGGRLGRGRTGRAVGGMGRPPRGRRPGVGRAAVRFRGAASRRATRSGRIPAAAAAAAGRAGLGARASAGRHRRPGVRRSAADRGAAARAARGVRRVSGAGHPGGAPQRGLALHVPRSRADAARAGRGGARAGPRPPLAPHVSRGASARRRRQRRRALDGRRSGGGWERPGCQRRGASVSTKKHAVKVMIGGEEYTVRSDLAPEYTREVAAYVDQALKKVLSQGPIVETPKAAILAGLEHTNEFFQAKQGEDEVAARLAALADDLTKLLPPGKRK